MFCTVYLRLQVNLHAIVLSETVARFPYYNEEYRNETFDVEKIPHPDFK